MKRMSPLDSSDRETRNRPLKLVVIAQQGKMFNFTPKKYSKQTFNIIMMTQSMSNSLVSPLSFEAAHKTLSTFNLRSQLHGKFSGIEIFTTAQHDAIFN